MTSVCKVFGRDSFMLRITIKEVTKILYLISVKIDPHDNDSFAGKGLSCQDFLESFSLIDDEVKTKYPNSLSSFIIRTWSQVAGASATGCYGVN